MISFTFVKSDAHMYNKLLFAVALGVAALAGAAPAVDHHQHLFSPALAAQFRAEGKQLETIGARDVVALLDRAQIGRAVVLSTAYLWSAPGRGVGDEAGKVRADNDWTAAQVAQYPTRLRGFCAVNPLKDYALAEIARCATIPQLRTGLKMHFGNADVQLENPAHAARLREVFRVANANGMAIAVHLRASISKQRAYGAEQATIFLEQLLSMAPNVTVQVAHLASAGPGYDDPPADAVMEVLAAAVEKGDPRTRRLVFDIASIVHPSNTAQTNARIARRIRQVGVGRVLYGSDAAAGDNLRPKESWAAVQALPLTAAELKAIEGNVAPYLQ